MLNKQFIWYKTHSISSSAWQIEENKKSANRIIKWSRNVLPMHSSLKLISPYLISALAMNEVFSVWISLAPSVFSHVFPCFLFHGSVQLGARILVSVCVAGSCSINLTMAICQRFRRITRIVPFVQFILLVLLVPSSSMLSHSCDKCSLGLIRWNMPLQRV